MKRIDEGIDWDLNVVPRQTGGGNETFVPAYAPSELASFRFRHKSCVNCNSEGDFPYVDGAKIKEITSEFVMFAGGFQGFSSMRDFSGSALYMAQDAVDECVPDLNEIPNSLFGVPFSVSKEDGNSNVGCDLAVDVDFSWTVDAALTGPVDAIEMLEFLTHPRFFNTDDNYAEIEVSPITPPRGGASLDLCDENGDALAPGAWKPGAYFKIVIPERTLTVGEAAEATSGSFRALFLRRPDDWSRFYSEFGYYFD